MVEMGGNVCQVICSVFQGLSFEAMCNTWGAVTAVLEKLCPQFPWAQFDVDAKMADDVWNKVDQANNVDL